MEIAVDVDGVLAEQVIPVLSRVNEDYKEEIHNELGRPMRKTDIKSWEEPIPGTDTDIKKEIEQAHEDREYVLSMPVIDGAKSVLRHWRSVGFTIIIATHRANVSDDATIDWLEQNSIPFDHYYNTNGSSKTVTEADILIDDYPGNITEFVEDGKSGVLFLQPWNETHSLANSVDSHSAQSWDQVKEIIAGL